ncbi:MAG: hypothetical protein Q9210_005613 [Variospora velana]
MSGPPKLRARRCASPRADFDNQDIRPWTPSPAGDDNIQHSERLCRQEYLDAFNTPKILSAVDEPFRYIPPGPYIHSDGSINAILTKEIGHDLRQSSQERHKLVGEYIFANYEPQTKDLNLTRDFGVYLAAAIAKHSGIQMWLRHYHSRGVRLLNLEDRYMWTRYRWYQALDEYGDDEKRLSDKKKLKLIRLEEELTAAVYLSYPCLLDAAYSHNQDAFYDVHTRILGIRQHWVPGKDEAWLEDIHWYISTMLDRMKRTEIDVRGLPYGFWEKFLNDGRHSRAWSSSLAWRDSLVRMANVMAAKARFEIEGFRGRYRYAFWDPWGFGNEGVHGPVE